VNIDIDEYYNRRGLLVNVNVHTAYLLDTLLPNKEQRLKTKRQKTVFEYCKQYSNAFSIRIFEYLLRSVALMQLSVIVIVVVIATTAAALQQRRTSHQVGSSSCWVLVSRHD